MGDYKGLISSQIQLLSLAAIKILIDLYPSLGPALVVKVSVGKLAVLTGCLYNKCTPNVFDCHVIR